MSSHHVPFPASGGGDSTKLLRWLLSKEPEIVGDRISRTVQNGNDGERTRDEWLRLVDQALVDSSLNATTTDQDRHEKVTATLLRYHDMLTPRSELQDAVLDEYMASGGLPDKTGTQEVTVSLFDSADLLPATRFLRSLASEGLLALGFASPKPSVQATYGWWKMQPLPMIVARRADGEVCGLALVRPHGWGLASTGLVVCCVTAASLEATALPLLQQVEALARRDFHSLCAYGNLGDGMSAAFAALDYDTRVLPDFTHRDGEVSDAVIHAKSLLTSVEFTSAQ